MTSRRNVCAIALALAIVLNVAPANASSRALHSESAVTIDRSSDDPDLKVVRGFFDDILDVKNYGKSIGRTFGHKRIQFMLMPMMYKMGVMMTMLMVLTVISLKGLFVGVTLLMLKIAGFIAKISTGWHGSGGWGQQPQPVHVHVHNSHPSVHSQVYSGWEPPSGPADEHYYYKG